MTRKKRFISVLLALAVLFVMLCSVFYIAAEAEHDCIGENCPICHCIHACRNALRNLSLASCAAMFAAAFSYALCGVIAIATGTAQNYTLVTLKVKLSD